MAWMFCMQRNFAALGLLVLLGGRAEADEPSQPAWLSHLKGCTRKDVVEAFGWFSGPLSSALGRAQSQGLLKTENVLVLVPSAAVRDELSKEEWWLDSTLMGWWGAGLGATHVLTGLNSSGSGLDPSSDEPYITLGGDLVAVADEDDSGSSGGGASSGIKLQLTPEDTWPQVAVDGSRGEAVVASGELKTVCGMRYVEVDGVLAQGGLWPANPCEGEPGPGQVQVMEAVAQSDDGGSEETLSACKAPDGSALWRQPVLLDPSSLEAGYQPSMVDGYGRSIDTLLCFRNPMIQQLVVQDVSLDSANTSSSYFNGCSHDFIYDGSPCNLQDMILYPKSTVCMYVPVPVNEPDEPVMHSMDVTLVNVPSSEGKDEDTVKMQLWGLNLQTAGGGDARKDNPSYGSEYAAHMALGGYSCDPKCELVGMLRVPGQQPSSGSSGSSAEGGSSDGDDEACSMLWEEQAGAGWREQQWGGAYVSPEALTYGKEQRETWEHLCSSSNISSSTGSSSSDSSPFSACMQLLKPEKADEASLSVPLTTEQGGGGSDTMCAKMAYHGSLGSPYSWERYAYWMASLQDASSGEVMLQVSWSQCSPPNALAGATLDGGWPSCELATAFA